MTRQAQRDIFLLLVLVSGFSCDTVTTEPPPSGDGLYVLNEGAFGQSNAELTFYSFDDGMASQNVFSAANPGKTLGDVANHMIIENQIAFVVVNNSRKLEMFHTGDNRSLGTVAFSGSPRQIAIVDSMKAYVTNMDSTVSVVNLSSMQVEKDIVVGLFPEAVLVVGGKAYVAVGGFGSGTYVSVVDVALDAVVKRIPTRDGPSYLVEGTDNRVYISCTGSFDYANPANDTDGAIMVIDPATDALVDSIVVQGHLGKIAAGQDGSIYAIGPGTFTGGPIWRFSTGPLSVADPNFIPGTYYAIGANQGNGDIYVGDAKGFSERGIVAIYSSSGQLQVQFSAGTGPTCFATN